MPIAVAIVEDNPDIRMGTSYILRATPGCTCVGEFGAAEDLLDVVDDLKPDVILMDIGLPGMGGIEATARLKQQYPHGQIVILSIFADDENIFRALCAGAIGYVSKPVLPGQLVEAVEHAFGGGTPMSPLIARKVLEMFKEYVPPPRSDSNLTPREQQVLEHLVKGDDYKQIAEQLYLSLFTVRAHVRNIYEKLHVHSKSQAVAKALQEKILPKK
jgi:DNA-binding NarL/FixJ family response regulator